MKCLIFLALYCCSDSFSRWLSHTVYTPPLIRLYSIKGSSNRALTSINNKVMIVTIQFLMKHFHILLITHNHSKYKQMNYMSVVIIDFSAIMAQSILQSFCSFLYSLHQSSSSRIQWQVVSLCQSIHPDFLLSNLSVFCKWVSKSGLLLH